MRRSFDFIVRTKQDLIDAVQEFGIVPLFENAIPGFSVEEHVVPAVWFDSEQDGVWEYTTPEKLFGEPFTDAVYRREPEESRARLLGHLRKLLPDAEDADLERFLK